MLYLKNRKYIAEKDVETYTRENGGCSCCNGKWFTNYEPIEINKLNGLHSFGVIIPKTEKTKEVLNSINMLNVAKIDYHTTIIGTWYSDNENKIIYDRSYVVHIESCHLDNIISDVKEIGRKLNQEAMGIQVDKQGLLIIE